MNVSCKMLKNIDFGDPSTLVISQLLLNLLIAAIVSVIIKIHYRRYGSVITNREEFSNVFPFITLTTVLVISVVKSSLALSLGLVGALSIVRFRTPIKEPEELAYLFISIAAGLGFGANQTLPTLVSILFILICISLIKFNSKKIIVKQNEAFDLKRLDISAESFQVTYLVNIKKIETLEEIIRIIRSEYPDIIINFIDQNQVPSI